MGAAGLCFIVGTAFSVPGAVMVMVATAGGAGGSAVTRVSYDAITEQIIIDDNWAWQPN